MCVGLCDGCMCLVSVRLISLCVLYVERVKHVVLSVRVRVCKCAHFEIEVSAGLVGGSYVPASGVEKKWSSGPL